MSEMDGAKTLLRQDPLLLAYIAWTRAQLLLHPLPTTTVYKRMRGVIFELDFSNPELLDSYHYGQPAMKAMLVGAYEPTLLRTMQRYLQPGGIFVDVGANIGFVSAYGASLVGKTGQVYSFEPVPKYFQRVQRLSQLNSEFTIQPNPFALGEQETTAVLELGKHNIGGNSLLPNVEHPDQVAGSITVPVRRLSDYLREKNIQRPSLIKIDVEGFEFPVLKGLADYLDSTTYRPPIICEVATAAAKRLGYTMEELGDYMAKRSYAAYTLLGKGERVDLTRIPEFANVLFLP